MSVLFIHNYYLEDNLAFSTNPMSDYNKLNKEIKGMNFMLLVI